MLQTEDEEKALAAMSAEDRKRHKQRARKEAQRAAKEAEAAAKEAEAKEAAKEKEAKEKAEKAGAKKAPPPAKRYALSLKPRITNRTPTGPRRCRRPPRNSP